MTMNSPSNWTGERVKSLRSTLKLSQEKFAALVGVRRVQTVCDWENGKAEPSPLAKMRLDQLEREHAGAL